MTGASSGIGEFMAIEFARNGAKIILSARSETNLERVKGRCLGENCNLFHLITKNKTNYFFLKKKHYNQLLKILDWVILSKEILLTNKYMMYCLRWIIISKHYFWPIFTDVGASLDSIAVFPFDVTNTAKHEAIFQKAIKLFGRVIKFD